MRARIVTLAGWLLTAVSFAGSFTHCVEVIQVHGQDGALAYVIAAMPEVSIIICVLSAMEGRAGLAVWAVGMSSFGFTVAANLDTADPGIWGHVVAVWPAWSAIGALWLAGGHAGSHDPAPAAVPGPVAPAAVPGPVAPAPAAVPGPVAPAAGQWTPWPGPDSVSPAASRRGPGAGAVARVAWAMGQPTVPSAQEIADHFGVSTRTGKRVRADALALLEEGQTAELLADSTGE